MIIYEPNNVPTVDDIKRILDKMELNSNYGYLPGGQSFDYTSSFVFSGSMYEDFPVKTVRVIRDSSFEYGYGVHLPRCKLQYMDQYFRWCYQTFGPAGFEMDQAERKFCLCEEKNRTMFMLKWS